MSGRVIALRTISVEPTLDGAWAGTAIGGHPRTRTWNQYVSPDEKLLSGIWECTPGVWNINYTAWEFCHLIAGHCTITVEGQNPVELRAGDVFLVETGAVGTWTVHETIRKHYVFARGH